MKRAQRALILNGALRNFAVLTRANETSKAFLLQTSLTTSRQKLATISEISSFTISGHPVMQQFHPRSRRVRIGVRIDQNLNWDCHIQSICKMIASTLGAIKTMP